MTDDRPGSKCPDECAGAEPGSWREKMCKLLGCPT